MNPIMHVEYWSNQADETLPLSLEFSPGGEALLWIRSNRDFPERAVLGEFRKRADQALVNPLLKLLESADFTKVPTPTSVVPGETVRKISLRTADGATLTRFVAESSPPVKVFADAEDLVAKIIDDVRKAPFHALTFQIDPMPPRAEPLHPASFSLSIINPGAKPIRFPMPKAWPSVATQAEWHGLRSDVPLAQMTNDHAQSLVLSEKNLPPKWIPPSPKDWVELAPGSSLRIPFLSAFAWPAGAYDLQFTCISSLFDLHGRKLDRVEWMSPKSPFSMVAK